MSRSGSSFRPIVAATGASVAAAATRLRPWRGGGVAAGRARLTRSPPPELLALLLLAGVLDLYDCSGRAARLLAAAAR